MNSLIKVVPNVKKYNDYLFNVNKGTNPIMLSGLTDSGKVHLAYSTKFYSNKPICIITYNEIQAKKLMKDMEFFKDDIRFFRKRDITSFDYIAESKDNLYDRIEILNDINNNKRPLIITTIEAVMQKMVSKTSLYKNIINIKKGTTIKLDELKEKLVLLGYERYELIEGKGQFSVRGGIIDISSNTKNEGIRIELWGDEVDSIRRFNTLTQRSIEEVKEVDIYPAYEFVLEKNLEDVCKKIDEQTYTKSIREKVEEDIISIKSGNFANKIDKYFESFYDSSSTFLDYISDDYIIFLDEIGKIKARSENLIKENHSLIKDLIEKNKLVPDILKIMEEYPQFCEKIVGKQTIYLEKQDIGFVDKQSMHAKRNGYSFSYREVNFFRSSMDLLLKELQESTKLGKTIVILGGSPENSKKMSLLLYETNIVNNYTDELTEDLIPGTITVTPGSISNGFESFDLNLLVISTVEVFESKKKKVRLSSSFKEGETIIFSDLKVGDYVVHKSHGIGQYIGVNTIKADGVVKDYIKIKYKDDDILYIPTNSLDSIRKYIGSGSDSGRIKLNRLGSKDWEKTKSKVKNNLRQVAEELIKLYAVRQKMKGFAFSKDVPWQKEFEDNFEYVETDDQLRCISEVKKDMEKPKPMDRLLCGDVGYGKTEVAIRAAFKSCMDQKQVAYLVPTTVLASQQYESFKDRMKEYPIRIELLNRFKTKKEQNEIVKKLELGEIDIIVGTHRILSQDVKFKDLGLLIIDEEHRFGVKAKEKIKELKNSIDVLTMTATPIPRTLHMSIVGMRDMSVIYEPPQNRKPVQTYVLEYDSEVIREAIVKELERDGQVFFLYNNVESIERKAHEISKLVPEAKIGYAHGKMTGNEIEEIMQNFIDGKINVLICTTILESGIDMPNANTIIVENADGLGLSQLYQIRGRVGRSNKQAYAYITYRRDKILSEVADKRLRAIKEFTEFGSGFKIAMRDLEIRGAGSLMGEMQHGHMEQVGYDTYCKLLDEVVKELRGEEIEEEIDVQIDLDVSSYIPDTFIENSNQKIEIYQEIALCRNEEDINKIIEMINDRFGKMPKEINNLLEIARIKNMAREKSVLKIVQKGNNIVYNFENDKFSFENLEKLLRIYKNRIKFSSGNIPYITFKILDNENILEKCKEFLGHL